MGYGALVAEGGGKEEHPRENQIQTGYRKWACLRRESCADLFLEIKFSCANGDREATFLLFSRRGAGLARTVYELMFSLLYMCYDDWP